MMIYQNIMRQAPTLAEQRFADLYADVADRLPGAKYPKVRDHREFALNTFIMMGLPHRRIEEWKYTDLRVLMPEVLPLAGLEGKAAQISVDEAIGGSLAKLDAHRAVFIDGQFRSGLSSIQNVPGITFATMRSRFEDTKNETYPLPAFSTGDNAISTLAAAFATDGVEIGIDYGTKPGKPIHLIFIGAGASPTLAAYQNSIGIGDHAEVTLIETHIGLQKGQSFVATELSVGEKATLKHVKYTSGAGNKHLASLAVELGAGAQYDPLHLLIDGAVTRGQANIRFAGEGARMHYTGGMLLRGQDHGDFTLVVDHAVPECESRELVKVVLDGRSRGVFQAKVLVRPDAQKTDGKQMSNALLLSDEAEFDAKPELEIYADDVACGHGATAGQLDDDLLFYLRARGIPEKEARSLLIASFIGEALDKIEHEPLRVALQEKVDAWLARA